MLRFIRGAARFTGSVHMPQQAVESGLFTFETPAGDQRNVYGLDNLIALASEFPGHQMKLFRRAYKSTHHFRDFVDKYSYILSHAGIHSAAIDGFIALAAAFPGQVNELFQLVLAQPNRMKKLTCTDSNISALVAAFPTQRDKLFQLIFTDVDHFKALVKGNIFAFTNICAIFPEKKEELCRLLLSSRDCFDVTISSLYNLEQLLEICPNQHELLFHAIVEDSVRSQKFVKKSRHIAQLVEIFPKYEPAILDRFCDLEVKKNVDMLCELFFVRPGLRLPKELVIYIAAMTGDYASYRNFQSLLQSMADGRYEVVNQDQAWLVKNATPSVSALIREHGLFMSVIRNNQQQPKTDQEQRSFDQQYALVVRRNSL